MSALDRKKLLIFLVIIALAVFLRVYNIGKESFWIDEGATAMAIKNYDGMGILKNIYMHGQILPEYYSAVSDLPVYYFTLEYWSRIFGISEFSLRIYSALFGILAVIFIFLLAKEIFNEKNAILSSFLLAISIPAIEFSQEARPYSLYLFLGAASTFYLVKSFRTNKNLHWSLYSIFTLLGLYTHYIFELLVIVHLAYALFELFIVKKISLGTIIKQIRKGSVTKKVIVVFLVIFIISLPLIPRTFRTENAEPWWKEPSVVNIAKIFVNFSTWIYPSADAKDKINSGLFPNLGLMDVLLVLSALLTAVIAYFLVLKLFYSTFKKVKFRGLIGKEKGIVLLALWFGFPLLFSLVFSLLTPLPLFSSLRYFLYCLPPFIILVSESMLNLKPRMFKFILASFILINILPLYSFYSNPRNQDFRQLAVYMKENVKDGEPVLLSSFTNEATFRYYYGDGSIKGVKNAEEAKELIGSKNSFWLVLSFWRYYDPQGSIQKYLNENYEIQEKQNFFDIEVYHYKKR